MINYGAKFGEKNAQTCFITERKSKVKNCSNIFSEIYQTNKTQKRVFLTATFRYNLEITK